MSVAISHQDTRTVQLLNDWWDFQPVPHPDTTVPIIPDAVPAEGWQKAAYLVPGFFTDPAYHASWRESRSGWMRTRFTIDIVPEGMRAVLLIHAAIPQAHMFINGQHVAVQDDMFIGSEVDVTEALQTGTNELAVFLTEFPETPHPLSETTMTIAVPWGCCISLEHAGIWQDVTLEWRPATCIDGVTIQTSVREGQLTARVRVCHHGDQPFRGVLSGAVDDEGQVILSLPSAEIFLSPGEMQEVTLCAAWTDYRPWNPHDPYLYHLVLSLTGDAGVVDAQRTRFGFREIWIEGHRIMLNGRPQRWAGEWGHKAHSHWLRPEYVRQWYAQLKDLHMHYARMHTFPHPEYFLDIADEMGILVCQETAIHGSVWRGNDGSGFWEAARAHVQHMVARDKNHPSLVLWSVENEMRWALSSVPSAKEELPHLRALFNDLDPTRPAYHDGDSGLWDEDAQAIISRHYGTNCHGWGWWDKRRPLHAGEMGRWHYGSAYVALQWAGDEVFADYAAMSDSLAREAARIIELGRANEVSCLFPWNTSGLDNFRPGEARTFSWTEPNTPYIKPLAHLPYESEYAWWEDGSGYRPGFSFPRLRHAFRPLAVVIREERTQSYTDRPLPHTVYVVNDFPEEVLGTLRVALMQHNTPLWEHETSLTVASGCTGEVGLSIPLGMAQAGVAHITTTFSSPQGTDSVTREITLAEPAVLTEPLDLPPIAIWGESKLSGWLQGHGIAVQRVDDPAGLDPVKTPVLVVAEHTVEPGSTQNQTVHDYAARGGRVLVLEQGHSLFPGLAVERMPIEMAHLRDTAHPMLVGIAAAELRFFGDDPFGLPSSDSWVTLFPYVKPTDEHLVRALIDSSGGDFGVGGLTWAPVIEAHVGAGRVIATQLRVIDRIDTLPIADKLLRRALSYLAQDVPASTALEVDEHLAPQLQALFPGLVTAVTGGVCLIDGGQRAGASAHWQARLAAGQTLLVCGITEEARTDWEAVIGRSIDIWQPEHPVYQLIRGSDSPLLSGISHDDTCWIDNYVYRQVKRKDTIVEALLTIDGGVNLLHNATRSTFDVLFGDERASEVQRMPTVSAYLDGEPPRVGGGLVEVKVGAGRVLFCQVRWVSDLWRFRRFIGTLLWNLGIPIATHVLAGPCTPSSGRRSDGFPTAVRMAFDPQPETIAEVLAASRRQVEYCTDNVMFADWPGWQVIDTPGGTIIRADVRDRKAWLLGMVVNAPEPRKMMATVGGLPNPDLQTFLRLQGSGQVQVWVNGNPWGEYALEEASATYVADIDFEMGDNFVVLHWEPDTPNAELRYCFVSKDRRPEITFAFPCATT